jgi:hypothetical protein
MYAAALRVTLLRKVMVVGYWLLDTMASDRRESVFVQCNGHVWHSSNNVDRFEYNGLESGT